MIPGWAQALIGVFFVAVGVAVIWKRVAFARRNADALRATWGHLGERSARSSTPGNVAFGGVGFVLVGAVIAVNGLLRFFQ